ncbi:hypothetical protein [Clostridium estertheticum]|uniref:hypothetical protein n=1 Tax=Clostridium estertheticum TaxID=238834 RepID=UPI001C0DF0D8|nr:hypothetical protein [Clostridium estertheticum]MBU3173334.1 hypothetical protein [Clostridium estertheticum]
MKPIKIKEQDAKKYKYRRGGKTMRKSITCLEILDEEHLNPRSEEDTEVIANNIKNKMDLWYGDDLKVYNAAGAYIADLKEVKYNDAEVKILLIMLIAFLLIGFINIGLILFL